MLYKIWFFWWATLISILAVENMVIGTYAYIFLDPGGSVWILVLIAAIIGITMWYCAPYVFSGQEEKTDSFNEF